MKSIFDNARELHAIAKSHEGENICALYALTAGVRPRHQISIYRDGSLENIYSEVFNDDELDNEAILKIRKDIEEAVSLYKSKGICQKEFEELTAKLTEVRKKLEEMGGEISNL